MRKYQPYLLILLGALICVTAPGPLFVSVMRFITVFSILSITHTNTLYLEFSKLVAFMILMEAALSTHLLLNGSVQVGAGHFLYFLGLLCSFNHPSRVEKVMEKKLGVLNTKFDLLR